ncbi:MAG: DUF4270 domain-containing protein [Bacteroidota bacterium]|nr:DUF4270 domain-containing protein [Bacteroidota bacterium]
MKKFQSLFAGLLLITLFIQCNEPLDLGSDIISEEWLNAKGVDSFKFKLFPYKYDSITTANPSGSLLRFPVGFMDDPIFGHSESGFASQLRFAPDKNLSILKFPIDSIILSIRYDTSFFYGDANVPMNIEVFQLEDSLDPNRTYYADFKPKFGAKKIGGLNQYTPNKKDSVKFQFNREIISSYAQIRIPIDTGIFMSQLRDLNQNDSVLLDVNKFVKKYFGIAVIAIAGNQHISFNVEHPDSRLTVFYQTGTSDSTHGQFSFNMNELAVKLPFYHHDYTGTPVAQFILGALPADSVSFIQGLNGYDTRLEMPYDPNLKGLFINYAVLELIVASPSSDNLSIYPPIPYLLLQDLSTGKPIPISDVSRALSGSAQNFNGSDFKVFFGGTPVKFNENGIDRYKYSMNLTNHFQQQYRMGKGLNLRISPVFKTEAADRVVIFGNGNVNIASKLKLTFSQ